MSQDDNTLRRTAVGYTAIPVTPISLGSNEPGLVSLLWLYAFRQVFLTFQPWPKSFFPLEATLARYNTF